MSVRGIVATRISLKMSPWLLAGLLLVAVIPAVFAGQSAREAARALPDRFRSHIVKISADDGDPDPAQWYFVCRSAHGEDGILSITVRNGKITSTKPSLDLRTILGGDALISLDKVLVDSRGAFAIAQRYVANAKPGRALGSASFRLQQTGEDAEPIWWVWCYDSSERYIGLLKLLASTGDVILWE